ncbi:MAG: hypothetical protein HQM04_10975 [Magnetococcales bacterium]|nr:hypothetical protein [Magnetococcales bacterium]MBF0115547.1 hypothetical protein [Magnetococcales bacterium]
MIFSRLRLRRRLFLHVSPPEGLGVLSSLKRQLLGILALIFGILLAIPGVPGPGFVFLALAFVLLEFPGKTVMIRTLRTRRWFRVARVIIHNKLNILLVLPKPSHPEP